MSVLEDQNPDDENLPVRTAMEAFYRDMPIPGCDGDSFTSQEDM